MSKPTKLQIKNIQKVAKILGIKVNTKGLTSKEAIKLYEELLLKMMRGNDNAKTKRKR